MFRRVFIALIAAVFAALSTAQAANQTTRDSSDIPALIQSLSDPDSTVRSQASERLATLPAARPELIRAARSDDPEQRARAAEILRNLPWYLPSDPAGIRTTLESYGPATEEMRVTIAARLCDNDGGPEVVLRLLAEEPSEYVRWQIVELFTDEREIRLHPRLRSVEIQKKLREQDVTADDPPVLVLCGRAWLERDPSRALGLFRRAVDADRAHPVDDHGVLSFAYDELIDAHIEKREFDRAAELLRQEIPRDGTNDEILWQRIDSDSWSLAELAALHRYLGPVRGHGADVRTWRRRDDLPPELGDRVLDLFEQLGVAPPLPREQPFELSAADHLAAGDFLYRHKFLVAADLELRIALEGIGPTSHRYTEYFATLTLARIAAEQNRDADAADFFERCARAKLQADVPLPDDDIRAQMHFRRARVLQSRGDPSGANLQIGQLLHYTPANNDDSIAIVRWLMETNRPEQAKALFEKIFAQGKSQLETEDFKAGVQNDLAWLCARCDERIDDAVAMSRAAIEAMPETPAFLDTAAEANYRKGNIDEAIRLESRALALNPENDFMREQVERFKAHKP